MKRFISTFCLLMGASVASYAGSITSATANLLGPSAVLQTFDNPSQFPASAFTSLPQTGGSNVAILFAGGTGTNNTGSRGAVSFVTAGNQYVTNFDTSFGGAVGTSASFARSLTFTFSGPTSEFLINYAGSAASSNYFVVDGLATQFALNSVNGQVGYAAVAGDPIASFTSATFFFFASSTSGNTLLNGDEVQFDNLRTVGGAASTTPPPDGGGGGGAIPEPSTYALIGAGLLALAYNRRKR